MSYNWSFKEVLDRSSKVTWQVEDLIGGKKQLDFTRPFLPESLARTAGLSFLNAREKLLLNQIRGHAYLQIFGLVEEFILPFVLDHVRGILNADDDQIRAYLEFAGEEAKHIQLFRRFAQAFSEGFPVACGMIGPGPAIAEAVLKHPPLSVALVILHIEWMTQRHYTDSIRDDQALDPCFASLLSHHWMEEMQHAQLDSMMVDSLASGMGQVGRDEAVAGYWSIGTMLDGALAQQTKFDLEALERVTGRVFTTAERDEFVAVQWQANRWTYLGSGMDHPQFTAAMNRMGPGALDGLKAAMPQFM